MQRCCSLELTNNTIRQVDLTKSLWNPLWVSILLSIVAAQITMIPMFVDVFLDRIGPESFLWTPIIPILYFVTAQSVVSQFMYGTKHRLICASFYKLMDGKNLSNPRGTVHLGYALLKWFSGKLGRCTQLESAQELCYVAMAYLINIGMVRDQGRGRWLRGAVQELNAFVRNPNFYRADLVFPPHYDTYKRFSRECAEEGGGLFRTREQVEFESWT
ncbi:hypothetical protein EDC59_10538 [Pseudodesulfovibrio indicus]|uniref:Uncharacterized protein n=2 Tax=Pseudodesulfovibrio indicus TaxID=1716143 RepID=A0AA94PPG4_9BACT|nr:hypothetical protein EDC59_10538 [Pseudodesulfovibrio indicus]